jgi:hypothetical protein
MQTRSNIPILRSDDGELLGYVTQETSGWSARTIFGYVLARTDSQSSAESVIRSEALLVLKGPWRYFDADDRDWFPCILKEVHEGRVIVVRTNELGYEDPEHYKRVILKNPTETVLQTA